MERVEPFIDFFMVVVTNTSIIYFVYLYLFILEYQIKMFRFFKDKVDTDTKVLKVLGLNMESTMDLTNERKISNTMALKSFYNNLLLSWLHSFPKL